MGFVIQVFATMIDPISLVGYVGAGAVIKKLPYALAAGGAWAVGMEMLVTATNPDYGGHLMGARIVGSLIATGIVFSIARLIRAKKDPQR